jgi:hypothetical protein
VIDEFGGVKAILRKEERLLEEQHGVHILRDRRLPEELMR